MCNENKNVKQKEETQFQVGDIVSAFGLNGVVTKIAGLVFVEYSDGQRESFTQDGREKDFHVEPSLKLISRPKPERKVEVTRAMLRKAISDSYPVTVVYEGMRNPPIVVQPDFESICKQLGLEE